MDITHQQNQAVVAAQNLLYCMHGWSPTTLNVGDLPSGVITWSAAQHKSPVFEGISASNVRTGQVSITDLLHMLFVTV